MHDSYDEPIGSMEPRKLAEIVCREAGDLCIDKELSDNEVALIVGLEMATLETYLFIYHGMGEEGIRECLADDECLRTLLQTVTEIDQLYSKGSYFYTISLKEIKIIVGILGKIIQEDNQNSLKVNSTGTEEIVTLSK
ncbi:hypothetical protein PYJP_13050 [Pyrofollis japonicus]|uniref:hypothetical protein n=1 Tax=Pyrofollis japonicus TaxID=3060460 RepID=UPI00295C3740|nr:hypothetical protein [Pyrofollis japonicus]BEP17953.1 hypothetical protein PYJP_13050 [Pyrofollis japonicus]